MDVRNLFICPKAEKILFWPGFLREKDAQLTQSQQVAVVASSHLTLSLPYFCELRTSVADDVNYTPSVPRNMSKVLSKFGCIYLTCLVSRYIHILINI
jgi:hypothetical protein